MNKKYNLNLPVYHREYGKMDITRFIETDEGHYDCDYYIFNDKSEIIKRRTGLFKESELMTLVEWHLYKLSKEREEKLNKLMGED
jgi:hypothetical protein